MQRFDMVFRQQGVAKAYNSLKSYSVSAYKYFAL
jgi:hypothetical protein